MEALCTSGAEIDLSAHDLWQLLQPVEAHAARIEHPRPVPVAHVHPRQQREMLTHEIRISWSSLLPASGASMADAAEVPNSIAS
ncbi:MAG: hypothetical protein RLZZ33_825 [Pseudomonadota bacterium]